MNVIHPDINYLRFILGGKDENRYPAFNGLFTKIFYQWTPGIFIEDDKEINEFLESIAPRPKESIDNFLTIKV